MRTFPSRCRTAGLYHCRAPLTFVPLPDLFRPSSVLLEDPLAVLALKYGKHLSPCRNTGKKAHRNYSLIAAGKAKSFCPTPKAVLSLTHCFPREASSQCRGLVEGDRLYCQTQTWVSGAVCKLGSSSLQWATIIQENYCSPSGLL